MITTPFYDPEKSYEENFAEGPFGPFADGEVFKHKTEPTTEFLGHKVYQPFGIPAGPLINSRFVTAALDKGFDICVYKTVRTREHPCHPKPNVVPVQLEDDLTLKKAQQPLLVDDQYDEPLTITNSFGVPSMDPDWWQQDLATAIAAADAGQVVIGSFQGTQQQGGSVADFIADYVLGARLVKEAGAPMMVANLSCPNESTTDLLCFDIERTRKIADKIKNEIGNTPLFLKLAYFADQKQLEEMVTKVGSIVDGFIAINTIPAEVIDETGEQALPGEGREKSGLCGAGIKWAGLEMVERMVALRSQHDLDFAVVGVGGVTEPEDYFAYRDHGADAVMSATGAMWNPYLAQEIEAELS